DRGRAARLGARSQAPHQPTAHVVASATASTGRDRADGTARPRGAVLVRSREVRGAQCPRLPSPHEPRGGAGLSHGVVPDRVAEGARAGIGPLARALAGIGITANAVTIAGGVLSIIGAGLLAAEMPLLALLVLLVGTLADTLDGQIAKASGGGTRLGAFLDSTVDRVADGALFVGAAASGANLGQPLLLW